MPNRIIIKFLDESTDPKQIVKPLIDDISLDIGSTFNRAGSVIPMFGLVEKVDTLLVAFGGYTTGLKQLGEVQIWERTEPIKFSTKLGFYLETDPVKDILIPVKKLAALTVLSRTSKGGLRVPGLSLSSLSFYSGGKTVDSVKGGVSNTTINKDASTSLIKGLKSDKNEASRKEFNADFKALGKEANGPKLISVKIPGIIYLPVAMVLSAKPIFSRKRTVNNMPIWAELEIEISGVRPANSSMIDIKNILKSGKGIVKGFT